MVHMSTNPTYGASWTDRLRELLRVWARLTERRIVRDRPWLQDLPDRRR